MTSLDSGTLKKDKKDKKKGKLTKAGIITRPSDFRHVSYVGWSPETGFDVDNLDPALKSLFDEAGVTANDLKDKETAAVIYDFIEQHGGMEVIKQRHQRPPPPPASVAPSRPLPAAQVVPTTPPSFHQQSPPPPPAMPVSLNLPPSSHSHSMTSLDSGTLKKDKKDKKEEKLTKADIGTPSDFRHMSHVGWNPKTGLDVDNLDPALKSLLDEAGVTANDLKDKGMATVICEFIEQHGGMKVIKQRHQRPPPPPASATASRSLPVPVFTPPPPPFQNPLPPPQLQPQSHVTDSDAQSDDSFDDMNNVKPKLRTVQITGLKEEDVERLKSFLAERRREVSESKPNVKKQTSAIELLEYIDDGGLPNYWKRIPEKKAYLTVKLDSESEEYKNVASGLSSIQLNIVQIERIQNPTLYRQYMSRKKDMDRVNGSEPSNERRLWHGTSPDNIPKINLSNFNRSYCGQHGVSFGNGVYFAVNPNYSINNGYCKPGQNGIKCIYQARVLTGKYTQGFKGLKEPPPLPGTERLYDSVVDNVNTPGMFVVFYDPQTYPEYLVTFK